MGGSYPNEERSFQAEGPAEVITKERVAYGEVEAMVRLALCAKCNGKSLNGFKQEKEI